MLSWSEGGIFLADGICQVNLQMLIMYLHDISAYLFLLNCDPNADVRRAVLLSIAPSTKTLASIVGRTRDVKELVRKTAYEVLAEKIHVKAMSIALRLQLMNDGLKDRSGRPRVTRILT